MGRAADAAARAMFADPRYERFCAEYYDNLPKYVLDHSRFEPTWQQMEMYEACSRPGCRVAVSSGHGCFGLGTEVLMFDLMSKGSELLGLNVRRVEDVMPGDMLMGDDGTPRTVLELKRGREELYEFEFHDGTKYVFNRSHILCLAGRQAGEGVLEVSVAQWLSWDGRRRAQHPCYRWNGERLCVKAARPLGVGDYYGFTLDGNGRFLGADFTVLHNSGKSAALAWILDWNLRVFRLSNAVLTANNVEQVRSVTWKYLETVLVDIERRKPWMRGMFILETKRYYASGFKNSWYVLAKTASKSNPEGLAGQHNRNLMFVVDEASGVDDAIFEVITGALTEPRNRLIMTSQPTRPAGKFAEAMLKLSHDADPKNGIFDAIWMNSEESPIVDRKYIKEKLVEYGGHHSPEYQIRVLGNFPDNLEGYLIPRHWCEDCQHASVEHAEDWGWVLCCDVAEGMHRDSSVATMFKISGSFSQRVAECVWCEEFLDLDELGFARYIQSKYREYPALSVVVDGDGAGRTVILDLEEHGVPVQPVHWGLPPHTDADKRRYFNLRAYAHYKLREAIFEGRFKGPLLKKFVEQASRLPYKIDERGRYQMESKDRMRAVGIKSPDISDTCCFAFLADYIPAGQGGKTDERRRQYLAMARAALGEDME